MQIKHTILITLAAVALGFYWNQESPPQELDTAPAPKSVEPQPEAPKKILKKNGLQKKVIVMPSLKKVAPVRPPPHRAKYPNLDDSYAPFDEDGNMYITQVTVQGKNLTFHGDLLLGRTEDLEKIKKMKQIKIAKPRLWPKGIIPYAINPSVAHPERIEEALDQLSHQTNVSFVERTEEKDFIELVAGEENCYSYIGRTGGRQYVYLAEPCQVRDILHELLHVLGFFHEQNRGDRDDFVAILWENIPEVHQLNFKKLPMDFMHLSDQPFSFETLMMYPSTAFTGSIETPSLLKKDGDLIYAEGISLSDEDVSRVNAVYPMQ